MTMTERQFTALAAVSGISPKTKRHAAAKLVLVHGWTQSRAAAKHEIAVSTVSMAVRIMNGVLLQLPNRIALMQEAMG